MARTRKTNSNPIPAVVAGLFAFVAPLALTLATATPAAAQFAADLRGQYDIFSGKNNPGPYNLAWNNISVFKEAPVEVVMDGRTLKPEEFTVDAVKGVINFTAPVSDKSVVRVHYSYEPRTARRNGGVASSPITLPLVNLGITEVKVIALPNNGGGAFKASDAPLVWSLGNSRKLMGGTFTSLLNFASAGNYGQQLSYGIGNDRNGLNANYYRAGKQFAATMGKSVGMAEAVSRWSVATRLAPMKWLAANYSTTQSDDLVKDIDRDLDVYALRLGGVGNVPTLNFQRTDDSLTNAQKQLTEIMTDKLDLSARLTKTTNLTATGTETNTDAPNTANDVNVRDASVTVTSKGATGATGAVVVGAGDKMTQTTKEEKQNVAVRIQPAPAFSVAAEKNAQKVTTLATDGKKTGEQNTRTQKATAEIVPLPTTKVSTTLSETTVNDVKVSATAFDASLGQGKRVEISTGVTNRSTEVVGATALDTTRAKVALRPMNNLTVTGGMTWNPEDANGVAKQSMRHELGMTAKLGALEVGSGYTVTTLNGLVHTDKLDPQYGEVAVNVGLRFDKNTRFDGTYKDCMRNRSAQDISSTLPRYQRSVGIGLTHNLGLLNWSVTGSMLDDRNKPANQALDYKAEAKLGLKF